MKKWRNIESAPRDGKMFLLCLPNCMDLIIRCRYNTVLKHFTTPSDGYIRLHEGQYWIPMPDPPTQEERNILNGGK